MSICYPPGPFSISPTERETARICSGYSFVFAAMSEGLKNILDANEAVKDIPIRVIHEAAEFLREAVEATGKEPPRNPVRSAFLWGMVNENLPRAYLKLEDDKLSKEVTDLASLVDNLKGLKKVPDVSKENYSMLQRFFQNLYDKSEAYADLLQVSDNDDE